MKKVLIVAGDKLNEVTQNAMSKAIARNGIKADFCYAKQSSLNGAEMVLFLLGGDFNPSLLKHMGEVARRNLCNYDFAHIEDPEKIVEKIKLGLGITLLEQLAATGT
jgi:hypothetical protein